MNKKAIWKSALLRVGCVSTRPGLRWLQRPADGLDLIEVRLDSLIRSRVPLALVTQALRKRKCPVVLTARTEQEGGFYPWKRSERAELLGDLLLHADAIDIELASVESLSGILEMARYHGMGIILSAHLLHKPLTPQKADQLIASFQHHFAHIYKIAALAAHPKDLRILARSLIDYPDLPLAVMATGELAAASRLVMPALGSRLVYGFLDKPVIAGQPSLRKLKSQLDLLASPKNQSTKGIIF